MRGWIYNLAKSDILHRSDVCLSADLCQICGSSILHRNVHVPKVGIGSRTILPTLMIYVGVTVISLPKKSNLNVTSQALEIFIRSFEVKVAQSWMKVGQMGKLILKLCPVDGKKKPVLDNCPTCLSSVALGFECLQTKSCLICLVVWTRIWCLVRK